MKDTKETIQSMREWPWSLIDAIGTPHSGEFPPIIKLPPDFDASLEYVLHTLPEKERIILRQRYEEKNTLAAISTMWAFKSNERPRQIIALALRHLRHRTRYAFLLYGVQGMIERETRKAAAKARERAVLEFIAKSKEQERMEKQKVSTSKLFNKPLHPITEDIANLDFSVRTYNCLQRRGIRTIEDILDLSCEELLKIRNLGAKSANEVIDKLTAIGYECSHLCRKE